MPETFGEAALADWLTVLTEIAALSLIGRQTFGKAALPGFLQIEK